MARYFLLYFSLISIFCLGAKFYEISVDDGQIIQWSPTEFDINFENDSWVMIVPENFHAKNLNKTFFENRENILITEPKREPNGSTGDLVRYMSENNQDVDFYCVEKAFYDCMELLVRYPQYRSRVKKLYVIFPDAVTQKIKINDNPILKASTGNKLSLLHKGAWWLYNLVFEIENSYKRFTLRSKIVYVTQNKSKIKKFIDKIEILNSLPKPSNFN